MEENNMGLLQTLLGKSQQLTNNQLALELIKRGKTAEQCRCIDFIYSPDEAAQRGCLGKKKKKKKGGCLSKEYEMDMNEYLEYVQKFIDKLDLKQRAINKIGLDESQISEIAPVVLSSFVWRGDGVVSKWEECDTPGYWMHATNKYSVTWIFFSDTQIYTYNYTFDTCSDNSVESTRDFFYTDITCIRTEHEVVENIREKMEGCGCLKKKESKFYHDNYHYDTLSITVPNDGYTFWCKTTDTIEQSIQATKSMIREKKNNK